MEREPGPVPPPAQSRHGLLTSIAAQHLILLSNDLEGEGIESLILLKKKTGGTNVFL